MLERTLPQAAEFMGRLALSNFRSGSGVLRETQLDVVDQNIMGIGCPSPRYGAKRLKGLWGELGHELNEGW